jgi:N-acyl-L-homoserine lactone synthetase
MIDLVLPDSRYSYAAALMEMHHDRKRVFVDTLHWSLPSPQCWLEVDDFDNEHAVYLLARSPQTGRHEGSVRLLPTTNRHMLGSLFTELCAGPVPVAEDCWEISRLVTPPPQVAGSSILKVHRLLALALVEFALINSIRSYTLVTEAHRVPALLSVGWLVVPLGLPSVCMGQRLQALQISVSEETLNQLHSRLRISGSVLRCPSSNHQAAA